MLRGRAVLLAQRQAVVLSGAGLFLDMDGPPVRRRMRPWGREWLASASSFFSPLLSDKESIVPSAHDPADGRLKTRDGGTSCPFTPRRWPFQASLEPVALLRFIVIDAA